MHLLSEALKGVGLVPRRGDTNPGLRALRWWVARLRGCGAGAPSDTFWWHDECEQKGMDEKGPPSSTNLMVPKSKRKPGSVDVEMLVAVLIERAPPKVALAGAPWLPI